MISGDGGGRGRIVSSYYESVEVSDCRCCPRSSRQSVDQLVKFREDKSKGYVRPLWGRGLFVDRIKASQMIKPEKEEGSATLSVSLQTGAGCWLKCRMACNKTRSPGPCVGCSERWIPNQSAPQSGSRLKVEALRSAGQVEKPLTPEGRVIDTQVSRPNEGPFNQEGGRGFAGVGSFVAWKKSGRNVHQMDQG
ncbi:hypothetical protein BR93DRAFT_270654 [Coniochaeta sp. PMI_546]|nr:hypothetical protein BR93DRAFT_270654 [Coniochaeta sp. PMI_546]